MKKKATKKLVLAKETIRELKGKEPMHAIVGNFDDNNQFKDTDKTVCWSVVCTNSGMYTCAC
jgi:hypothetical protein